MKSQLLPVLQHIMCCVVVTWWCGPGGIEACLCPAVLWHCWLGLVLLYAEIGGTKIIESQNCWVHDTNGELCCITILWKVSSGWHDNYINYSLDNQKELKSWGMVKIPYEKGLIEAFSQILKTYRLCTAVRPHTTLRNMLVHPKDRINDEEKPEVVYKIPCKNCEHVYVGETGRPLGVRIKEHHKEVDSITGIFTRAEKTRAASVCNKSAITDHVCNENHVIDWDKAKVIDRESDI